MMSTAKLSLFATAFAIALFVLPMAASAAYTTQSSPLASTYVTFKVVNVHGVPQAGVRVDIEHYDTHIATLYTNSHGIVTLNLAKFSSTYRLFFDFEKGNLGASFTSLVGHIMGKTITITLRPS